MSVISGVLALTLAAGLVNGAFLAAVLFSLGGKDRRTTQFLAILICCLSLMTAEELVSRAGLSAALPHTVGSTVTLDFLVAPLLFHYARSLTHPPKALRGRDWLQLVPFIIANLVLLPFYLQSGPAKLASFDAGLPSAVKAVVFAKIVIVPAYLAATIGHLTRFLRQTSADRIPTVRLEHVIWFRRSMILLVGVAAGSLLLVGLEQFGVAPPLESDDLGSLAMCAAVFLITFLMIKYPLVTVAEGGGARRVAVKYETSPLAPSQKSAYLERLRRYMEQDKPYLDMELSLDGLAEGVGIPPSHLSQVLNESAGVNYYDFVNAYRVEEAKRRIETGGNRTMLALAHEAGFNSKASFNRAFKRFTGATPTEYAARSHRSTELSQPIE